MTVNTRYGISLKALFLLALVATYLNFDLAKIFLGAFFLKMTGNYRDIGTYVATVIGTQLITFIFLGKYIASSYFRIDKIYKVSFLILGIVFLLFGFFYEHVPEMPMFYAVFHGFGLGFFWASFNMMTFKAFRPAERGKLYAAMPIVAALVGIFGRPIQGWSVTHLGGFHVTFWILSAIYFIVYVIQKQLLVSVEDPPTQYDFRGFFYRAIKIFSIRRSVLGFGLLGWTALGSLDFILPAVLYRQIGSEFILGLITAGLPIIDITVAYLMWKSSHEKRNVILVVAALLGAVGAILLSQNQTLISIIVFMILWEICAPVLIISSNILSASVTDLVPEARDHTCEYMILREVCICSQRVISIGVGIWLSYFLTNQHLVSALLLMSAAAIALQTIYLLSVAKGTSQA